MCPWVRVTGSWWLPEDASAIPWGMRPGGQPNLCSTAAAEVSMAGMLQQAGCDRGNAASSVMHLHTSGPQEQPDEAKKAPCSLALHLVHLFGSSALALVHAVHHICNGVHA